MRISKPQRMTLYLLLALEQRKQTGPQLACRLMEMVNANLLNPVVRQNYNKGLKTLAEHGLLRQFRDRTLKLGFTLTDLGRAHAEAIAIELEKEQ